jgi:2-methylcitrate dehydratase PrpD
MTTGPFIAEQVASFAMQQRSFPPEVENEAKRLVLDQLGCQIASSAFGWSSAYHDAIRSFGGGPGATVVFYGGQLPLDQAVFVNSTFGHGAEYDDTQLGSSNHSGAVVVPPVLAVGEQRRLPGRAALDALIVGLETGIRIGEATVPHMFNRGHHVPPATGPFGSAAASSRIMQVDEEVCVNALAIAGSHAGGHLEYTNTGGSVKRCHCAIPAASGLRSTLMAVQGVTGPRSVFEGKRGFLATFAGQFDIEKITGGLGDEYRLMDTSYKMVASPYSAQGCLQAFDEVVSESRIQPEQIESIEIVSSPFTIRNVGVIIEPSGVLEAHFSTAFGCAVRLFRGGNGIYDYRAEDLRDPKFLEIARRVTFTPDEAMEADRVRYNSRPATAVITTKDGRRHEKHVRFCRGTPLNRTSNDELASKVRAAVVPRLGETRAEEILEKVWNFDKLDDVGELVRLTVKASA